MVLTVFYACQRDGLEIDQGTDLVATEKPDVYLEEDYLVFKDYDTLERVKYKLKNESIETQMQWEQQFGFKSAKTYRAEICKKLEETEDLSLAENFIFLLEKEGYFSMQDSSITYPFYNFSWGAVLNPEGLIKIDNVLYCFQEDRQISVLNGKTETLLKYLRGDNVEASLVRENAFNSLKSTTPSSFGTLFSDSETETYNYTYRVTISLRYEAFDYTSGGTHYLSGVGYDYYLHQERKQNWWWIDNQTNFYGRHFHIDIGGNSVTGVTIYPRETDNTITSWEELNSSKVANLHIEIYHRDFASSILYPSLGLQGPTIWEFGEQAYSNKVGTTSSPLEIIINQ